MVVKNQQKRALEMIDELIRLNGEEQARKAMFTLGFIRPILENCLEVEAVAGTSELEIENGNLKREIKALKEVINEYSKVMVVEVKDPVEEEVTFEQFCENQREILKHDIIAEEDKTLYKNRAYFKTEVCKRWPNTNSFMKKFFKGNGIANIEDFCNYFDNPANWGAPTWSNTEGLKDGDWEKIHNLYICMNEEAGELADAKLDAYLYKIFDSKNLSTRSIHYLNKLNIYTKAQLRTYVKLNNALPYGDKISNRYVDIINERVREELALHEGVCRN